MHHLQEQKKKKNTGRPVSLCCLPFLLSIKKTLILVIVQEVDVHQFRLYSCQQYCHAQLHLNKAKLQSHLIIDMVW